MTPSRAARICSAPGCGAIVERGRCPVHTVTQQERRFKDPEQQRFYNSTRWKQLRAIVRAQEPKCAICTTAPTALVDHIDGDWRNNLRTNLRGLCVACNATRTGQQHRAKTRGGM